MSKTGTSPTSADVYDHQISLFDSTYKPLQPENLIQRDFASVSPTVTSGSTVKNTTTPLSRKWTLREELARRKYAKWQERGLQGDGDPGPSSNSEGLDESSSDPGGGRVNTQRGRSNLMDDSDDTGAQEDRQVRRARSPSKDNSDKESSEVDILYENQRGSFLCGIPLYSHNSLLNFDPAPWTNAAFKDSPVDITTAQPPDPTWDWAWRSWYVDMSADVDEDGWEYSLAFSPYFSWHGTHPWFHSFVRRRRWLRKRVKRRQTEDEGDGLMPGSEYFSVSSNRDQSKDSSTVKAKSNSHLSHPNRISHIGTEVDVQEIRDFETLMVALRNGRIDREKIEAVTVFLDRAGEELSLLAEHVSLSYIHSALPLNRIWPPTIRK